MVVARAAAAVRQVIPKSQAEVQGNTALVKVRAKSVPNIEMHGGNAVQGHPANIDLPDGYGVMFVIRLEPAPYSGPTLPKDPQLNTRTAKRERHGLFECFRTTTRRDFSDARSVLIVDVLFGQYVDAQVLQRAYAEAIRVVTAELKK